MKIPAIYRYWLQMPIYKFKGNSQKFLFVVLTRILLPLGLISSVASEAQAQFIRVTPNATGGQITNNTTGTNGVAIGDSINATGGESVAIGSSVNLPAAGNFAVAIGAFTSSTAQRATEIGRAHV